MCFDEFYSLSFQEAREKEKREQEKKKRDDELRKLKRLQKLRDAAHARRRIEEEKKLKHAPSAGGWNVGGLTQHSIIKSAANGIAISKLIVIS